MRFSARSKVSIVLSLVAFATIIGGLMAAVALRGTIDHAHAANTQVLNCARTALCTEVADPEEVFGEGNYVGHDHPSTLFYSNKPGSGNNMRYELTLPTDPPAPGGVPTSRKESFNFQLHPAFWFGMAMCDTQSYPQQVSTCAPDSDSNIVDPAVSPNHPGTAFMELQFYLPGWVKWPGGYFGAGGTSCDAAKWCIALNIDSLSQDPVHGTAINSACASQITGGLEYINFAFITKNGHSPGPANPVQATATGTFTANPAQDLFMKSGDRLVVTLHDTRHGLRTDIQHLTTGQSGVMVASAANGFGQEKFAPAPATECTNIPYDFHPMYSTSSEQTRVIWAAHSYNIAFSDEIGHFDYCNGATIPQSPGGVSCPVGNTEGMSGDTEPTETTATTIGDDNFCFPATQSSLVKVQGCTDTNTGFDGVPYKPVWPDGNTSLHPTSILFTSPLTGPVYHTNYKRMAFEADLPRIEFSTCNRTTGAGCTLIPTTDDNAPADFYPFFSTTGKGNQGQGQECMWQIGNDTPATANDFGKNNQYGSLLPLTYLAFGGGGATIQRFNDFRQILSKNPCMLHENNNNEQ